MLSSEAKHTAQTAGMLGREGRHSECETTFCVVSLRSSPFPAGDRHWKADGERGRRH